MAHSPSAPQTGSSSRRPHSARVRSSTNAHPVSTFGTTSRLSEDELRHSPHEESPGVGQYNASLDAVSPCAPRALFSVTPRWVSDKPQRPRSAVTRSPRRSSPERPAYSSPDADADVTPSSAAYSPKPEVVRPRSARPVIGASGRETQLSPRHGMFVLGTPRSMLQTPGVGAYRTDEARRKTREQSPTFSFGHSARAAEDHIQSRAAGTIPGPGAYDAAAAEQTVRKRSPTARIPQDSGATIVRTGVNSLFYASKRTIEAAKASPGSGAYHPSMPVRPNAVGTGPVSFSKARVDRSLSPHRQERQDERSGSPSPPVKDHQSSSKQQGSNNKWLSSGKARGLRFTTTPKDQKFFYVDGRTIYDSQHRKTEPPPIGAYNTYDYKTLGEKGKRARERGQRQHQVAASRGQPQLEPPRSSNDGGSMVPAAGTLSPGPCAHSVNEPWHVRTFNRHFKEAVRSREAKITSPPNSARGRTGSPPPR